MASKYIGCKMPGVLIVSHSFEDAQQCIDAGGTPVYERPERPDGGSGRQGGSGGSAGNVGDTTGTGTNSTDDTSHDRVGEVTGGKANADRKRGH